MTTLQMLLPELILLIAAGVVLTLDLVTNRQINDRWLMGLSAAGFLAAAVAAYAQRGITAPLLGTQAIDGFATFLKVLVLLGMVLVVLSAAEYIRGYGRNQGEFYTLLLTAGLAISVAVSANDLLMVYLSMEFLSINSYILAAYLRGDRLSIEAGVKYFVYGAVASGVMLYGISLIYGLTGSTNLVSVAEVISRQPTGPSMQWLGIASVVLLMVGFGFKASLVPFAQWVPDTYQGSPTPITAFLSTASKAAGFALLVRVMLVGLIQFSGGWLTILAGLSMITMTLGNLVALKQTDVKRLLAYSSIAQAGYMLIGLVAVPQSRLVVLPFGSLTFNGINGVLVYIFGYLFTNLGAFAVVIAIENATRSTALKDYAGLGRRAPALALLLTLFLLSLAGIPPTLGFWAKYYVFAAAVQINFLALLIVAIVNSVVGAAYYLNIIRYMYLMPAETEEPIKASPALNVALAVTGVMVLIAGLVPGFIIDWANRSVDFVTRL
ncbi:MAG: NADH-quinone oxidoreductase subunit N [Caldilineales bacterium]|nr:NADH-quinone oxidoreductase subunit N [Caldilineales bacterium]MDW8318245.1 NADH-quinone oxidoreductase subunit N [Anaerolineae bacterium]